MKQSCLNCKFGKSEKEAGRHYCEEGYVHSYEHDCGATCGCGKHEFKKEKPTKMDKQTAIINHRHMWNWLSENPEMEKSDYMGKFNIDPIPDDRCFICEYNHQNTASLCGNTCILEWPDPGGCSFPNKLFGRWSLTSDLSRRAELARQIRDLPERIPPMLVVDPATMLSPGPGILQKLEPTPPPKLTRSEAIAKTRKQWRWYARYPEEGKKAYFKAEKISDSDTPLNCCYLCESIRTDDTGEPTYIQVSPQGCGSNCPFKWPGGCCSLENLTGLFDLWLYNPTKPHLRISISTLISSLPEKPW